jgi:predicted secreted protein
LADARSGRVVFVSHCLLNQNTRYLGGAACPGAVRHALDPYLDAGVGIVQMPCPEQRTWGGVLKRRFLWMLDHPQIGRAWRLLTAVVRPYLRWRYRRIARAVARDVADYTSSGFDVLGLLGVAGSPSCGAGTTMDLATALRRLGSCPHRAVSAEWLNSEIVAPATCPGDGLFIETLTAELTRHRLDPPVREIVIQPAPADGVPATHPIGPPALHDGRSTRLLPGRVTIDSAPPRPVSTSPVTPARSTRSGPQPGRRDCGTP